MHILTKIFIVLTALLTVALVPLVMINTANDETFKKRWLDAQADGKKAIFEKDAAQRLQDSETRGAQNLIQALQSEKSALVAKAEAANTAERAVSAQAREMGLSLQTLTSANSVLAEQVKIGETTTTALLKEMGDLRTKLTSAQQDNIRLDEAVATLSSDNETYKQSLRQLQEELKQARAEKDQAQAKVSQMVSMVGDIAPVAQPGATRGAATMVGRTPADRSLSARIIAVRRGADSTLAEINAGSRDGVQPGWTMSIAEGGKYLGNLRITTVDVNRSVGVVELEDAQGRGEVKAGLLAMSRKGE